ncbi:MAG: hypothetical protein KatS3mg093_427 [Candidatus Parcubacteria bacterium]|nr:MAG: hypothetical protein KatS3mg093_427 [Candidatus Parcubacteria bacterium]
MAKQGSRVLNFVAWLTGVIVSLSVGFAMVGGTLTLPSWLGGRVLAGIAGWVVIITTALSALFAILNQ